LALSASASACTSALRLSNAASASTPANLLLFRVGRTASRLIGSRLVRGVLDRLGFGAGGFGIILLAVVLISLRIALLVAMFSRRLRSNALMAGSFLGGILLYREKLYYQGDRIEN
jgi:phosphoglycerol transferase MdoB-like AlkP superfamily enzyme